MALEAPDSLGLLNNHFQQYGMLDNEAWGRPRDPNLSFANYVLALYYRYLNLGFRLPPSAGSASGVLANPVGYNRIYAPVAGELTVDKWYSGFREHRGFVTNGPMLFWNPQLQGNLLRINVEAIAREPIDRIEIVANGKVLRKVDARAGARTLRSVLSLDVKEHSWVAARCYLKTSHTVRMAHTSPLYLPGTWDASEDARYFLTWIDELIAKTSTQPNKDALHALYRRAREFYAAKAEKTSNPAAAAEQPRLPLPPRAEAAASNTGLNGDIPFSGELYRKGIALFGQGRLPEAAAVLREAVSHAPDHAEAQKALGVVLAAGNDYAMAEPHFARACALHPSLEDACYYHARALYLLDRYTPAIELFGKLLTSDPDPGRVYWALAQALEAAGQAAQAEAAYRKALESGHRAAKADGDTRVLYGVFLYRQGRVEEALAMYRKAVEARPDSPRAHAELGRVFLQIGRTEDAIRQLEQALALDSSNEAARLLLDKAKIRLAAQGSSTSR
jgi:tetratricopeptide (TPR) repeat protein